MVNFVLMLIILACAIFFLLLFLEQYFAEKRGELFIVRPSDSVCNIIARRSAELNMSAEEYIIYSIEGDDLNVRSRKNRPYLDRYPHDLPSSHGR